MGKIRARKRISFCPKGERGESGSLTKITINYATSVFILVAFGEKMNDKLINNLSEYITQDKKEAFVNTVKLVKNHLINSNAIKKICNCDVDLMIGCILFVLFREPKETIGNTEIEISDPEKFCNYCIEFLKEKVPYYESIEEKFGRTDVDSFTSIAQELSNNIITILKNS